MQNLTINSSFLRYAVGCEQALRSSGTCTGGHADSSASLVHGLQCFLTFDPSTSIHPTNTGRPKWICLCVVKNGQWSTSVKKSLRLVDVFDTNAEAEEAEVFVRAADAVEVVGRVVGRTFPLLSFHHRADVQRTA
jgi:hypothetical protein